MVRSNRWALESVIRMRWIAFLSLGLACLLSGCAANSISAPIQSVTSVTPSSTGIPNYVLAFGDFEFVSVQAIGQIFTYNISGGTQVVAVVPYTTPCKDPSGMVIAAISGSYVMAVVCYDTGSLITLTVHGDGSLTPLGSVSGLVQPYPGIVVDGTNVYVPLVGVAGSANGAVAKVSIAAPSTPVITATAMLASPAPGAFVNPGYLAASGGYIFATAGSENTPQSATSTVQVINESSMSLVGSPLIVAHSPQQIAVQGSVAYVTTYDAQQLESIDISTPSNLNPLQILSLSTSSPGCTAEPVAVYGTSAFVGCNGQGTIDWIDITNPSAMKLNSAIPGVLNAQRLALASPYVLATDGVTGGNVYQILPGTP